MAKQNAATKQFTPLQAISQGTPLPPVPSFTDFELHRHWILEHMVGQPALKLRTFVEAMPNSPSSYRQVPSEYSPAKDLPKACPATSLSVIPKTHTHFGPILYAATLASSRLAT
jgi:hypothetical protein